MQTRGTINQDKKVMEKPLSQFQNCVSYNHQVMPEATPHHAAYKPTPTSSTGSPLPYQAVEPSIVIFVNHSWLTVTFVQYTAPSTYL